MIHIPLFGSNIISYSFSQCCKILLANQANPSDHDIDGFTAADLAEYNGHHDCARYLCAMEKRVSSLSHLQYIFILQHFSCFVSALPSCLLWHENQSHFGEHGQQQTSGRSWNLVNHFLNLSHVLCAGQACPSSAMFSSTQPDCFALTVRDLRKWRMMAFVL